MTKKKSHLYLTNLHVVLICVVYVVVVVTCAKDLNSLDLAVGFPITFTSLAALVATFVVVATIAILSLVNHVTKRKK